MPRPSAATIVLGVLCLGALSIAANLATRVCVSVPRPVNSTRPTCGAGQDVGRVEFTDSAPGKPAGEHAWSG